MDLTDIKLVKLLRDNVKLYNFSNRMI